MERLKRTIDKFFALSDNFDLPPHLTEIFLVMKSGLLKYTFRDYTHRNSTIAAYRASDRRMRKKAPAERVLIFNVADGWGPLRDFLGIPVPDTAFPHHHHHIRREFWEHFGSKLAAA